jgi:hypothetical protein
VNDDDAELFSFDDTGAFFGVSTNSAGKRLKSR